MLSFRHFKWGREVHPDGTRPLRKWYRLQSYDLCDGDRAPPFGGRSRNAGVPAARVRASAARPTSWPCLRFIAGGVYLILKHSVTMARKVESRRGRVTPMAAVQVLDHAGWPVLTVIASRCA